VFEIHIDVRRLLALLRHEPLEQHLQLAGAHRGDAEAEADDGVGGRAASLAEDVPRAREADHIVHGEEERLVVQLGDDGQLLLEQRACLVRHAIGPAFGRAGFGQMAQPGSRRVAGGHQLMRILVAQFIEAEMAARGDGEGFCQQLRRIQAREFSAFAQVPLAIGKQAPAGLLQRDAVADRSEHILQQAATGLVHVHVATGHRTQAQPHRQRDRGAEQRCIVAIAQHRHTQPQRALITITQPAAQLFGFGCAGTEHAFTRQPDQQAIGRPRDACRQIIARQPVAALARRATAARDQRADLRITAARRGQRHELQAAGEREFAADDQRQPQLLRAHMRAHHAGHRAFIGERQRAIAQ
jgi:hypothetical protein